MHMQDGIGRGGYRLLATVFLGIGVLGLVTTLYAFQAASSPRGLFDWLGFGLSFVALVALFALTLRILWKPGAEPAPVAAPQPAGAPPLAPSSRPIEFEFNEPETGPEVAIPIAPAPPAQPMGPPNRNLTRDTKGWPRRQPPSGLTMGERRELQAEAVELLAGPQALKSPARAGIEFETPPPRPRKAPAGGYPGGVEFKPIPTPPPRAKEMAIRVDVPTAIARVAGPNDDPEWNPPGTTRGRCSGCSTMLYAPQERPIHLRCPKCEKLTLLK